MTKLKFFLDFEKEEKWLEKMSEEGWLLRKGSLLYHFEQVEPKKREIRIDYREFGSKKDFENYKTIFEDSGWRHLSGTKSSGSQYFLKVNEDSTGEIFSDELSKAGRYKRLADAWVTMAIVFLPFLVMALTGNYAWNDGAADLLSPKGWFLTPGLWDLKGAEFVRAFLFELPFALLRGLSCLLPVAAVLVSAIFSLKSERQYRAAVRKEE